jgi:hypothetical protein
MLNPALGDSILGGHRGQSPQNIEVKESEASVMQSFLE